MKRPLTVALAVLLALVQPLQAATPQDIDRARQLSAQGAEAFRNKNFEEAIAAFEEANRLVPHPNLDVNIGRANEALSKPDRAMIHCKIALNAPGVPDATRQAAQQCVDRVQKLLTRPVLTVDTRPQGAVVRVDGTVVGTSPYSGEVEPGRRQVDVELEGYAASSRTLNAERGDVYPLEITLTSAKIGGILTVTSIPSLAYVFLDGDEIGPTPLRGFQLDAKRYSLEVRAQGYAAEVSTINIEDGKSLERSVTLVPIGGMKAAPESIPRWPAWTMIGTSAVSIGIAGYFGAQAIDDNDRASVIKRTGDPDDPDDISEHDRLVSEYDDHVVLANVFGITGGLLLAGGLTWLFWPDPVEAAAKEKAASQPKSAQPPTESADDLD